MNINNTPFPVRRAIKKLGNDIRDSRKRRRLPMWLVAERASISRSTLTKIENGNEGVSFVSYAKILFVLGMINRLAELADQKFDILGLELEAKNLPKRIRIPSKEKRNN